VFDYIPFPVTLLLAAAVLAARDPSNLPFPVGTGGPFPGVSGCGMQLATHLHLVPRLSMRGAIPPLPLYVSMAWTNRFPYA